ncbi:MAG: SapC family protein [Woeseiaceae bacterium]
MTEEAIATGTPLSGKLFLYKEPELLAPETHATLGFTPAERPFDFVRNERVIPLTLTELSSAQRHYPIIFSQLEQPLPLAVVGVIDEQNLFVDEAGNWDEMCYLPMYLRCYPFAFATGGENQLAVVVDRAADSVVEDPQYPFFNDGKVSEHSQALMQLCMQYDAERRRTVDFCEKLRDLGLLTPMGANFTPGGEGSEPEPLAEYVGINTERLKDLSKDEVFELHGNGFLSGLYMQLYSIENWRHLMARREQRGLNA